MMIPSTLEGPDRLFFALGAIVQAEAQVTERLFGVERAALGRPPTPTARDRPDRRTCRRLADAVLVALGGDLKERAGPLLLAIKDAAEDRNEAAHSVWFEVEDTDQFRSLREFFIRGSSGATSRSPEDLMPLVPRFELLGKGLGHLHMLVLIGRGEFDPGLRESHLRGLAASIP